MNYLELPRNKEKKYIKCNFEKLLPFHIWQHVILDYLGYEDKTNMAKLSDKLLPKLEYSEFLNGDFMKSLEKENDEDNKMMYMSDEKLEKERKEYEKKRHNFYGCYLTREMRNSFMKQ